MNTIEESREACCAWFGPDVAASLGIDVSLYSERLKFWAENQERWGRSGKVAA